MDVTEEQRGAEQVPGGPVVSRVLHEPAHGMRLSPRPRRHGQVEAVDRQLAVHPVHQAYPVHQLCRRVHRSSWMWCFASRRWGLSGRRRGNTISVGISSSGSWNSGCLPRHLSSFGSLSSRCVPSCLTSSGGVTSRRRRGHGGRVGELPVRARDAAAVMKQAPLGYAGVGRGVGCKRRVGGGPPELKHVYSHQHAQGQVHQLLAVLQEQLTRLQRAETGRQGDGQEDGPEGWLGAGSGERLAGEPGRAPGGVQQRAAHLPPRLLVNRVRRKEGGHAEYHQCLWTHFRWARAGAPQRRRHRPRRRGPLCCVLRSLVLRTLGEGAALWPLSLSLPF